MSGVKNKGSANSWAIHVPGRARQVRNGASWNHCAFSDVAREFLCEVVEQARKKNLTSDEGARGRA